jgi:GT2 family glycosyltransferase
LDTLLVLTVRRDTPKQFHTNLSNLTLPEGVVVVVYGFTDPVDWLSHNVQFIDDWNVLSSVILNTSRLVWWDTRVIVKPSDVLTLLRKGTGAVSTDVPLGDVPAGISDVWACDSAQVPKMFNSYGELVGGVFHKESRKISVDSSRWVASTQTWISSGYNVDFAPRVDLPEVVYYGDSVKEAEPRELDLTIAVTAVDHPQMTINAIESMLSTTEGILREIFVWDNASTDPDMHLLYDKYVNHPVVKIFKSQTNRGYIYPMNTMGKRARGKFYVVSNNDIIVHPGWFEALSEPFKDPLVAQTGPVPEYGYLNEAMLGGPGEGPLDYLEGYFFMLPHWVMDRYPVFDEAHLKFATCEDADLSLRLREMGYKILAVPEAKIDHLRSITRVNNAPIRSLMDQTEAQNVKYMLHRWRNYLTTRTFVRHCILVVRGGANGDLLSCEGALKALRWKFPLSRIVLMTKCGAIMENCPWVDDILDSAEPGVEYHLVINLDSAYEVDLGQNRPRQVARLAGVPYVRPGYWTKQSTLDKIRDEFSAHPNLLVVHWRASWANRRWPLSRWKELTQKLSKDFQIVEVGSLADERVDMGIPFFGRSWDEVAALTAISRGVVCSDSVGLHIGVGVKVPTICIFGPTDPKLVADSEFLFPVSVPIDLECLGCHHKPPFPKEYSTCSQPQLYCQIGLTVCRVYDEVMRVMGIDKVCTQ